MSRRRSRHGRRARRVPWLSWDCRRHSSPIASRCAYICARSLLPLLMLRSRLFLIACVWALTTTLRVPLCPAQTLPQLAPEVLTLNNLEAFSSVPQNWRIVGDAWVEPDFDGPLRTAGGDGILAFRGVHEEGDLVTSWIHGDLDLELEVMLGPGGESGVLLQ